MPKKTPNWPPESIKVRAIIHIKPIKFRQIHDDEINNNIDDPDAETV